MGPRRRGARRSWGKQEEAAHSERGCGPARRGALRGGESSSESRQLVNGFYLLWERRFPDIKDTSPHWSAMFGMKSPSSGNSPAEGRGLALPAGWRGTSLSRWFLPQRSVRPGPPMLSPSSGPLPACSARSSPGPGFPCSVDPAIPAAAPVGCDSVGTPGHIQADGPWTHAQCQGCNGRLCPERERRDLSFPGVCTFGALGSDSRNALGGRGLAAPGTESQPGCRATMATK